METGDNQGMLSEDLAFSKRERENDVEIEASNLIEKILARENMTLTMKRVIKNDGSKRLLASLQRVQRKDAKSYK